MLGPAMVHAHRPSFPTAEDRSGRRGGGHRSAGAPCHLQRDLCAPSRLRPGSSALAKRGMTSRDVLGATATPRDRHQPGPRPQNAHPQIRSTPGAQSDPIGASPPFDAGQRRPFRHGGQAQPSSHHRQRLCPARTGRYEFGHVFGAESR